MVEYARPADFVERGYVLRTLRAHYRNFNVSAKLANHVDAVVLSNALKEIIRKNMVFVYNFYSDGERPFEETLGHDYMLATPEYIRFEDVVTFEKIDSFDGPYLASLNKIIVPHNVPNHPMWRVKVVETKDGDQWVSVIFDHGLIDGNSGRNFLSELSKECSKVTSAEFVEEIFNRERDADVIPAVPIESSESSELFEITWIQRMLFTVMFSAQKVFGCFSYIRSFFPYNNIEANTNINPPFVYDIKDREIGAEILSFNPEELKQILKKCRSQKVTLTTYVQALALATIEDEVYKVVSPKPHSDNIIIAVDGRRYLPPTPKFAFGNISIFTGLKLSPVKGNEWNVMRYLNEHLKQQYASKSKNFFMIFAMMRYFNVITFLDMMENSEISTSVLSNIGQLDDTKGKYEIVDAVFSQSAGGYFGLNLITTEKQGLKITLTWQDVFEKVYSGDEKVTDLLAEKLRENILTFPVKE